MRPVQMSSEGHWDKQALVSMMERGGVSGGGKVGTWDGR